MRAETPREMTIHGVKHPSTRSENGILAKITDDDARALLVGDVLVIQTPLGLTAVTVQGVREGPVYDKHGATMDESVPVVDCVLIDGRVRAVAVPDLYVVVELEPTVTVHRVAA